MPKNPPPAVRPKPPKRPLLQDRTFTAPDIESLAASTEYHHCTFNGLALKRLQLEDCAFDACTFVITDLSGTRFNGSTFRGCDLSNTRLAGTNLFGVAFDACKLLAIDFSKIENWTAIAFKKCNLNYAKFRALNLTKLNFQECSFENADLSFANLEKATFENCNLTHVDFTETKFFQTDLRGSNLTGLNLRLPNISGIIITPSQFQSLAQELGIQIIENTE